MPYIAHTYLLYKTNKILKMQDLYELQSIIFMTNYERNTLPASFNNMYTHNFDIHPHIRTSTDRQISATAFSICRLAVFLRLIEYFFV